MAATSEVINSSINGCITFKVAKQVKAASGRLQAKDVSEFHQKDQKVYRSTESKVIDVPFDNGFVGTIFHAYCHHYNLVVSPDHVWVAIMHAFNIYMNEVGAAEDLRTEFVYHKDKMTLEVKDVGTLYSVDWNDLITRMSHMIDKNTTPGTVEWVEPNFSTTTYKDRIVGKVMLMSVLQQFFKYKFSLLCGIPQITLEGTTEDWKDIRRRIDRLPSLGLKKWHSQLAPVLDQFVRASSGKPDADFWNKVCHEEGGGSGPRYLAGWINVFIPFIHGKYVLPDSVGEYGRIDTNSVPAGILQVPFELDDNGYKMNLELTSGFFGATQPSPDTLRPAMDWAIRDPTKKPEIW